MTVTQVIAKGFSVARFYIFTGFGRSGFAFGGLSIIVMGALLNETYCALIA
ncbi:MAG: hypothetical protein ABL898_18350 [Hyphomicrobiaceae bacterium]|nr:hypothetical protein [Hyphomicrobiaceae bacterium]